MMNAPRFTLITLLAHVLCGWEARAHDGSSSQFQCADVVYMNSCPRGWFCDYAGDAIYSDRVGYCNPCPDGSNLKNACQNLGLPEAGAQHCSEHCMDRSGAECSRDLPCSAGTFCNFDSGNTGTCQECADLPDTRIENDKFVFVLFECFESGLSELGAQDCYTSCFAECFPELEAFATVDGKEYEVGAYLGTPNLSTSGLLVDCGKGLSACRAAENSVCLVEKAENADWLSGISACEEGGGVAVMIYDNRVNSHPNWPRLEEEVNILPVALTNEDGKELQRNKLGTVATVSARQVGELCMWMPMCSDETPCKEGEFCNYDLEDRGFCETCPEGNNDNLHGNCFFNGLPERGAESCANVCGAGTMLTFPNCKFCPKTVSTSLFGGETKCELCPNNDLKYPQREMRMFGSGVTCQDVRAFFTLYDVDANHQNCQLAQMQNFVCGCSGPGYGGANSEAKRTALVWLPRTAALLSFMASMAIIIHVMKRRDRRQNISNQFMVALSSFDLIGSAAYSLTTLPLPQDDYIYGSEGNMATCKAQGFFIQMGTISAYLNVSLALYYYVVVKLSWNHAQVKKIKPWLFVCPVTIGMTLAFAGIPFYDNMILWCNNSAAWWPEIPMAIAIFIVTVIMATMCWHVFQEEKASRRWRLRRNDGASSLSEQVFWQAIWYLMAFYFTWPPYLALQYLWASGKAFSHYGFILYAGTVVPMQGVWNLIVYNRKVAKRLSPRNSWATARSRLSRAISFRRTSSTITSEISSAVVMQGAQGNTSSNVAVNTPSSLATSSPKAESNANCSNDVAAFSSEVAVTAEGTIDGSKIAENSPSLCALGAEANDINKDDSCHVTFAPVAAENEVDPVTCASKEACPDYLMAPESGREDNKDGTEN